MQPAASAENDKAGEAEYAAAIFAAGSEGTLSAWLVAGPFAEPYADMEAGESWRAPPREGYRASGAADLRWTYCNALGREVTLTADTDDIAAPLYFYADCDLIPVAAGEAHLILIASVPACLWIDGVAVIQTAPRDENHAGMARLAATEGDRRCRIRLAASKSRVSFGLVSAAPAKAKNDRVTPQRIFDQRLLLRGLNAERWRRLWQEGIRCSASPRFVDEAKRVVLALRPLAGCPRATSEVSAFFYPAGGGEWPRIKAGPAAPDVWHRDGLQAETEAPAAVSWDRLEIVAELRSEEKTIAEGRAQLLCEANLRKWREVFGHRLREEIAAESSGAAILRLRDGCDPTSAALAMLRWEQIGLLADQRGYRSSLYGERFLEMRDEAEEALRAARAGRDILAGKVGLVEAAYLSHIDGSAQPYFFYRPRRAAAAQALPLVVLLHGYVPSYNKLRWMTIDASLQSACEDLGFSLLLPFGRGNTDFLTIGEVDVLQAIDEVAARWGVDVSRIYLAGYSMGGSGVWTLLSHYPDRFAAALVWSGRNDYFYWHEDKYRQAGVSRDTIPAWKRFLILVDNPYDFPENLRHMPLRVVHPPDDSLVQPGQSTRIYEKLKPPAGRMELIIPPAGDDHWYFCREVYSPAPYRWLLQHRRQMAEKIEHIVLTPKYGKRDWLIIHRLAAWGTPGRVKAYLDRPNKRIVIDDAQNVAGLGFAATADFDPAAEGWRIVRGEQSASLADIVQRQQAAGEVVVDPVSFEVLPPLGNWMRAGKIPPKHRALCGPVKEAFNQPFLLVVGTAGDNAQDEKNHANAEQFSQDWRTFAHAVAPQKLDIEVTAEDIASRNLILFGTPATNSVLARMAELLPFRFLEDGYGVGDAVVKGAGLGFCAIYPNPEAPAHYAVIIDGRYYGTSLPFNHKWDLAPDYIVFGEATDAYDGTPTALLAGHFDAQWRYDPQLATGAARAGAVPEH